MTTPSSPIRPVLNHMGIYMGIYVHDMARMEDFYTRIMGLVVTDRGKAFRFPIDLVFLSSQPGMHHQLALASGRPSLVDVSVRSGASPLATAMIARRTGG